MFGFVETTSIRGLHFDDVSIHQKLVDRVLVTSSYLMRHFIGVGSCFETGGLNIVSDHSTREGFF